MYPLVSSSARTQAEVLLSRAWAGLVSDLDEVAVISSSSTGQMGNMMTGSKHTSSGGSGIVGGIVSGDVSLGVVVELTSGVVVELISGVVVELTSGVVLELISSVVVELTSGIEELYSPVVPSQQVQPFSRLGLTLSSLGPQVGHVGGVIQITLLSKQVHG